MDLTLIKRLRADTPGCNHVLHLNNAGAALPPAPVIDAVSSYFAQESIRGGYEAQEEAERETERFYTHAAELIHCDASEIAFLENATRAWDMAFYSFHFKKGDTLISSHAEYASNYLAFLQTAKRTGVH